ncbi:unnamed protein product, partial [Arctogadus glacialis]
MVSGSINWDRTITLGLREPTQVGELEDHQVTQRLCSGRGPSDADGRRRDSAPRHRPPAHPPTRTRPSRTAEGPPLRPRERSGGATRAARRATWPDIVPEKGT